MLLGAIACFASGLAVYMLSRAGYFDFQATTWNFWQFTFKSLLLLVFAVSLPPKQGK